METLEGNKLIAEFMGWKYLKDTEHPHVFPNGAWNDGDKIGHKDLLFHTSWDWLMPVVEKIESEEIPVAADPQKGTCWPFKVDILSRNTVEIWNSQTQESIISINKDGVGKIEAVYQAAVQFIQWYNEEVTNKQLV